MKFASAFLAVFVFVFDASAQTASDSVVIKDWCPWVLSLEFSPNGGELARRCFGYAVALYDTSSYRRARTFLTETEHTPELREFAYSPDGTVIATVEGSYVRLWNAADPGKPIPKEELILVKAKSNWVVDELYALDTPLRVLEAPPRGNDKMDVLGIAFSPDGKLLITTHRNDRLKIWNASSWTMERELISGTDQGLDALWTGFSPDGKLLITMRPNGHVKVWNTSSWTVEGELVMNDSRLTAAAFAPDSRTIMIADANGVLHYWRLASKAEIETLRTLEGFRNDMSVSGLEFSPDGETLVATTTLAARPIVLWNTTDWTAETESGYNSAAFSKDGKLLALGGRNHIKLIEPVSRKQIRDIELPEMTRGELRHNDQNEPNEKEKIPCLVSVLAVSPDGNTLAAGCRYPEGTVRVVKITP
jgi:WD40 repeat protein